MDYFYKQPSEKITRDVDFTETLPSGATLSSTIVAAINDSDGSAQSGVLTSASCTISGNIAKFTVQAGVSGITYKVTVTATLSNSNILEKDILMYVKGD